jgi:hypothetical protein
MQKVFVNLQKVAMAGALKYIVDDNGNRTSVLVPVKVWEDLNSNYERLQAKLGVLSGLRDGLSEVKRSKKSGRKLQTLKEFLK